jgi:hypothetical protein
MVDRSIVVSRTGKEEFDHRDTEGTEASLALELPDRSRG